MDFPTRKLYSLKSNLYVIELKINEGKEQELRALIDEMVADTGQDEGTEHPSATREVWAESHYVRYILYLRVYKRRFIARTAARFSMLSNSRNR